jgi:hypothetical protein
MRGGVANSRATNVQKVIEIVDLAYKTHEEYRL